MASTVSFFSIFGAGYGKRQKAARDGLEPIHETPSDLGRLSEEEKSKTS
jgi:hypothetical protein